VQDCTTTLVFTAPCYSNGAVLPSYDVRPSFRLSVTLVIPDHMITYVGLRGVLLHG